MRLDSIRVVAKREYLQRIKGKAFWIATCILPLLLVSATVLPSIFLARSEARQKIVVVDSTGGAVAAELAAEKQTKVPETPPPTGGRTGRAMAERSRNVRFDFLFEPAQPDGAALRRELDRRVIAEQIDAWVWVDAAALAGNKVEYHARSVSNFLTQEVLKDDLSTAIRRVRLRQAGLDPERIGALTRGVDLSTLRVAKGGSRAEGGLAGAAFGYIIFMMLYVAIGIWGQQVMNGVLDEKSSRIIEVVISSIRPTELMMGKLVGICLLGLTQMAIWCTTLVVLSTPGFLAAMVALPEGVTLPVVTLPMVLNFGILFVLGFFVFASFYAAVGAAFNNVQEAQQVAGFIVFFLLVPLFLMFRIINDPDSTLAVVTSLIPPFTPLLMTLRVALQMPPLWQILLSYALTAGFIVLMVWIASRIYRVGILMYGKKPTVQEMWKWVRHA
ncbi:MAG TPA: ABC transporter permease [Thermoanaerobaculia bacterium]|jgi:ABC-2 type transport system permease protein